MKSQHFTDRAREVIEAAEREARGFNHQYVGTEHLLLGLVEQESGVVVEMLRTFGLDAEKVRGEIEKLLPRGLIAVGMEKLPLTPRAQRAIEFAAEDAALLNQKIVDTEHLFLGLIREPRGVAGMVMRNLGVSPEKAGPQIFKVRLEQMKIVERVVRPVRAGVRHKRRIREELLAHLTAIYDEEMSRLNDSAAAALTEANRRFGDSEKLARELETSLPWSERLSFAIERHLVWRAPESAARYCVRLGINFNLCVGCIIAVPLFIEDLLINKYDTVDWWIVLRECSLILFWIPAGMAVLTWMYFKLRDAMWGVFGSRKSIARVAAFASMMAAFTFVFILIFLAIGEWNPDAVEFWAWRAAIAAVAVAIVYNINARLSGPREISDTIWASLNLDA